MKKMIHEIRKINYFIDNKFSIFVPEYLSILFQFLYSSCYEIKYIIKLLIYKFNICVYYISNLFIINKFLFEYRIPNSKETGRLLYALQLNFQKGRPRSPRSPTPGSVSGWYSNWRRLDLFLSLLPLALFRGSER